MTREIIYYDYKGEVLDHDIFYKDSEWISVIPDTSIEHYIKSLCNPEEPLKKNNGKFGDIHDKKCQEENGDFP